ncbi:MAG TPA: DUF1330 domain-containing protein [Solirubrobacterales bacterium]|nr:DUF1330 domain-containing protein [Solirubrobacterales bacterium]HNC94462.1 DUF1330 domain-containing protein [Solirubrobacterales bacterium]
MSPVIDPTPEQFKALVESDDDSPIVMVNLIRFKDQATGIDEGRTGAEAYATYGQNIARYLAEVGGEVLIATASVESIIGPEQAEWDAVLLVRYPSRKAFIQMITNPGYQKEHEHRAAGVEEARLILSGLQYLKES